MSDHNRNDNDTNAWQRWEMASLGESKPKRPAPGSRLGKRLSEAKHPPGSPPAVTIGSVDNPQPIPDDVISHVAQIGKTVRETARKEGYAEGLKQGHAEGFAKGKAEAEKIGRDEGFQAGHREGYEKGLAEGRAISHHEAQRLTQVVNNCADSLQSLDQQISESLVDLALNIARQVIRSTLAAHPEKIVDTVQDILHVESPDGKMMYLRLHPEDIVLLKRHLADDPRLHNWHLEPDEHIERGGCSAQTALGDIDATMKTRWERIAGSLRENPRWAEEP